MHGSKFKVSFSNIFQRDLTRLRPDQKQRTPRAEFPAEDGVSSQRTHVEIGVSFQWIRLELIRLRLNQFLEIGIVSNGNERLDVELKTQRRGKTDVRSRREVKCLRCQLPIDIVFFDVSI